jgi:hypothetical protein
MGVSEWGAFLFLPLDFWKNSKLKKEEREIYERILWHHLCFSVSQL